MRAIPFGYMLISLPTCFTGKFPRRELNEKSIRVAFHTFFRTAMYEYRQAGGAEAIAKQGDCEATMFARTAPGFGYLRERTRRTTVLSASLVLNYKSGRRRQNCVFECGRAELRGETNQSSYRSTVREKCHDISLKKED